MSWEPEHDPFNPDATPDYDSWGWDDYWSPSEWLQWHATMKARYGLECANTVFLSHWNNQSMGANPLNARTFDSNFREYAKVNGFYNGLWGNAAGAGVILRPVGEVISSTLLVRRSFR